MAASEEHRRLFQLLNKRGTLTLRAQLDLWQMLHPVTQPGSKLDFEYPPETVMLSFHSTGKLKIRSRGKVEEAKSGEVRVIAESKQDPWLPLEITLETGAANPKLELTWHTAEDPRPRALQLRRILLPWATAKPSESSPAGRQIPELAGGN